MTLADFLLQFWSQLYAFWPFRIVQEGEQVVRYFMGHATKTLTHKNGWRGRGLHAFWPVLGAVSESGDATWGPVKTSVMDLTTRDRKKVTVQVTAVYRMEDMRATWTSIGDPDRQVAEFCEQAAGRAVPLIESERLVEDLPGKVEEEIKRLARGMGLRVKHATATTLVLGEPVRLIQDAARLP